MRPFPLRDKTLLEVWREQVATAAETPWLIRALAQRGDALIPQFAACYTRLRRLPRRTRRALQRRAALSLGGLALLFALGHGPAQAAVIEANGATCTLANAIIAANTDTDTGGCPAGNGADTITFDGRTVTLSQVNNTGADGPNGLPVITSDITITGPGIIERSENAPDFRILEVNHPNAKLTLQQTTVRNGVDTGHGGGIFVKDCLFLSDGVSIIDSAITGNTGDGVDAAEGSGCPVTVSNSVISGNTGYGIDAYYAGPLHISNSIIHNNHMGGIAGQGNRVSISNTTISENKNGGGIFIGGESSILINNSSITGNTSITNGGGIRNPEYLTIINSTISGNTALGSGGGIDTALSLYISHSTITNNHAGADGGGVAGIVDDLWMSHSLVSGNTASGVGNEFNTHTFINQSDFNIVGLNGDSGVVGFNLGPTDIVPAVGVNLGDILDPNLAENGGATQTHALVSGSLAIDAGGETCADVFGNPLTTDQRGQVRPADGNGDGVIACDIGAFEFQMQTPPGPASPCEVMSTNGEVTGFAANDQEVNLPNDLHRTIDRVATQEGYLLSLYTWFGSTAPFEDVQGELDLEPDTQVKKVKCLAIDSPEPPTEPDSPCEVMSTSGEVTGFAANDQEVNLPNDLHRTIDRVATQEGYLLSLYTWFGSTAPFEDVQGELDLEPDTQVKKVKCLAIDSPEPPTEPDSPCEVMSTNGEVTGFVADDQEVNLPNDLHRTIDRVATQEGYLLSLYTWFGSTAPFEDVQGELDLEPDTQVKKVKCQAIDMPEPPTEPDSPCEVMSTSGEVTSFVADDQEVNLPNDLHRTIDRVATQEGYLLSLYTWFGSTAPFEDVQGELDLEPDTQVKKVKCQAL